MSRAKEMQELLERWERSGLSQRAFAEQEGVSYSQVLYWRRRLGTYLDNQWQPLVACFEDPELEIHNNDAERALRHVVTGRKNWMFFGSQKGGEVGARLFSLIATCKAMDINPEAYLEDVIRKIDTTPASEIARLTPWAWAEEQANTAN